MSARTSTPTARGEGAGSRRRLRAGAHKLAVTIHVVASVALLGTTAVTLVLALRAVLTDDAELASATYRLMEMVSFTLNIPLSLIALASGIVLGRGTRWGVLRYRWVTTKLVLLVAVVAVGALVVGEGLDAVLEAAPGAEPTSSQWQIVVGATIALVALLTSATLGVYKPGGRWREGERSPREADGPA